MNGEKRLPFGYGEMQIRGLSMTPIENLKFINEELKRQLKTKNEPAVVFFDNFTFYLNAITKALEELHHRMNEKDEV